MVRRHNLLNGDTHKLYHLPDFLHDLWHDTTSAPRCVVENNGLVNDLVQELSKNCNCELPNRVLHCLDQITCRCTTTGTSTMAKNCACGISTVICTVWTILLSCSQTGKTTTCPKAAPVKSPQTCTVCTEPTCLCVQLECQALGR